MIGRLMTEPSPVLYARSSSHMSRVVLLIAAELQLECQIHVVKDLLSQQPEDYGGNPALKVPSLQLGDALYFGALHSCRKLWQLAKHSPVVHWPEDLSTPLEHNALETILNGMSSEVVLILNRPPADVPHPAGLAKTHASLRGGLQWLEQHLHDILAHQPPEPTISYLTTCLFCYLDHLPWRQVHELTPYPRLAAFRAAYAQRPTAQATQYHFDP